MLKTKAFSLIEMMFVIIVIAVIAVYAVNMLNKRAQTTLATKTAAQMQQWLQAAQNYYEVNQQWPSGWSEISGGNSGAGSFLPNSARCSEILNDASNSNCGDYGYFQLYVTGNDENGTAYTFATAPYINVETQVPNEVLGKQIAGMLPNGIYSDSCHLYDSSATGGCVSASVVATVAVLYRHQKMAASVACSTNGQCESGSKYCYAVEQSIENISSHNKNEAFITGCSCPDGTYCSPSTTKTLD